MYDEDGLLYGGYENKGIWREMAGSTESPSSPATTDDSCMPLIMVCLQELPANAEVEVELILASRQAASCLDNCNGAVARSMLPRCDMYQATLDQLIF